MPRRMIHQPPDPFEAYQAHLFRTATSAYINIRNRLPAIDRMAMSTANPSLRYTVEPLTPGQIITSYTVPGISSAILSLYAPNVSVFLNSFRTLVIPASFYNADLWPFDNRLRDGRPFSNIFEHIRTTFAAAQDRVDVRVSVRVEELCSYLSAFLILGMRSQARQIERILKGVLKYRPLNMKEVKAVWAYHLNPPNPMPDSVDVPDGFMDNEIMGQFARNLKELTTKQWRNDFTGRFDEMRAEYGEFLYSNVELRDLMYNPNLHTWVTMIHRVADTDWSKARTSQWIVDNGEHFGRGVPSEMPAIIPLYEDNILDLIVLD